MEMAMFGVPVIVSGQTHYRGRGFTYDPDSWVTYFKLLGQILSRPEGYRLTRQQVESAWEYAYRFFFEYPRPFPWHLVRVWDDYKARPISLVCGPEGQDHYRETFKYLVGDPINWSSILKSNGHQVSKPEDLAHAPDMLHVNGKSANNASLDGIHKDDSQPVIPQTGGQKAVARKAKKKNTEAE
jgi:hypothetical protein